MNVTKHLTRENIRLILAATLAVLMALGLITVFAAAGGIATT